MAGSDLLGRLARRDLLDQFDDAAAELGVRNPPERTGQGQAFGGCQKIGHVGRRGALAGLLLPLPWRGGIVPSPVVALYDAAGSGEVCIGFFGLSGKGHSMSNGS